MSRPDSNAPLPGPACSSADWPSHPAIKPHQPRNLLLLATHQIVFRVGWIFKTESVMMPAFLDQVAGAGWIRGCLPVLNRLGQSVPPVFTANYLKSLSHKKRALALVTALQSLPFAAMSIAWFAVEGARRWWMPGVFLVLYCTFFIFNGLYHLSFGTVQGKLIQPTRRGHLLLVSTFWGAIPATLVALWLLPGWLESPFPGWGYIFAFVAVCFLLSGLTALMLFEPGDTASSPPAQQGGSVADMVRALSEDANLRRLVLVAMLFASGLIIFPHYQAFARERMGLAGVHLMLWVVAQNVAVAIFSLVVGPLADLRGYRLTLRLLIFTSAVAPAFAVSLPHLQNGGNLYWIVFIFLGVTPLVLRTLLNYALELCEPQQHPRYLSTVSLGLAVPFLLSPAVGGLIDATSFELVFVVTVCLILLSGCLTFRLHEPRHGIGHLEQQVIDVGPDE